MSGGIPRAPGTVRHGTKLPFVRQKRIGSIWHIQVRSLGAAIETACSAAFTARAIERSAERPIDGDLCTRCLEASK